MNIPFKKKRSVKKQFEDALAKLIIAGAQVERIMNTFEGDTKHTINLKLCLEDMLPIAKHMRKKLIDSEKVKTSVKK